MLIPVWRSRWSILHSMRPAVGQLGFRENITGMHSEHWLDKDISGVFSCHEDGCQLWKGQRNYLGRPRGICQVWVQLRWEESLHSRCLHLGYSCFKSDSSSKVRQYMKWYRDCCDTTLIEWIPRMHVPVHMFSIIRMNPMDILFRVPDWMVLHLIRRLILCFVELSILSWVGMNCWILQFRKLGWAAHQLQVCTVYTAFQDVLTICLFNTDVADP